MHRIVLLETLGPLNRITGSYPCFILYVLFCIDLQLRKIDEQRLAEEAEAERQKEQIAREAQQRLSQINFNFAFF
jgi:hypothetical protein